jgi:hypothetical protein
MAMFRELQFYVNGHSLDHRGGHVTFAVQMALGSAFIGVVCSAAGVMAVGIIEDNKPAQTRGTMHFVVRDREIDDAWHPVGVVRVPGLSPIDPYITVGIFYEPGEIIGPVEFVPPPSKELGNAPNKPAA